MSKMLMIYPERCSGCHECELACSFFHDAEFRPHTSRIQVSSWEMEGLSIPTTCMQCEDAPCAAACPAGALSYEPENSRVAWDEKKCIGCRMCTLACPFGAIVFEAAKRRIIKCDLCDGNPECVRVCPESAIVFVEDTDAARVRKKELAIGFKKLFEEVA